MKPRARRPARLRPALLALPLIAAPGAQAAQNYFDLSLEQLSQVRISVASSFPEDYLGASSSVSVLSEEEWKKYGARRPADALATLPSVMSYPSLGAQAIAIRGFSQSTSVRGIATLLDGVPLNGYNFGSALYDKFQWDLDGLQRIQVVRGPSSALYGSDAFHGVIAMESFGAEQDGQRASAHLGSDHYWHTAWRGSQGGEGGWRLDASLGAREKPAEDRGYRYTDPTTGRPGSGDFDYRHDAQSAILKLRAPEQDNARYDLGLYSNRYRADGHPGIGQYNPVGQSLARSRDFHDSDTGLDMLRGHASWTLDQNRRLEALAYHWRSQLEQVTDRTLGGPTGAFHTNIDNEQRSGLQLSYQHHLTEHTDWLLSGSGDRIVIDEKRSRSVMPDGTVLADGEEGDDASRRILGAVSQFKTRLLDDRLTLIYGGRYDDFSDVGGKLTPRAGAIFQPDLHNAYKLLYGNAFRAPTAVEIHGVATVMGDPGLEPETIDTWELVHMYQGEQWRSELVGFYSEWRNGIIRRACAPACPAPFSARYENVARSQSRGAEWIGEAELDAWQLRTTLTYTESTSEDRLASGERVDTRYSAFPRWLGKFDLGYRWPSGLQAYVSNSVHLGASEGVATAGSPYGREELKDYWRSDLFLERPLGERTEVSLSLRNIFDRENWRPSIWNTEQGLVDEGPSLTLGVNHEL